jgi:3-keto-disaccharide hydrolase
MLVKINSLILLFVAGILFPSLSIAQQLPNTLSAKETQQGWQLLFNGKDLLGWHSYMEKVPGKAWQVQDGAIFLNKNNKSVYNDFADLVTDGEFENFDLKLEWKMEPCANSGVMFYVHESSEFKDTYESGPEMQIADLACNDDGRILKCRAGDLYDLISADTEWVNKASRWNQYEIIAKDGHLTFYMNGHKTIDTQLWDAHWLDMIKNSKFVEWPGFGTFKKGHISLQGTETGKLWYRNIKIRKL